MEALSQDHDDLVDKRGSKMGESRGIKSMAASGTLEVVEERTRSTFDTGGVHAAGGTDEEMKKRKSRMNHGVRPTQSPAPPPPILLPRRASPLAPPTPPPMSK